MAVAAAGIADEGHHGVEEVARTGWAASKRSVGTGAAATATGTGAGTGADMRWDRQESPPARARTCTCAATSTSTSGGSARILVGGRRQHDGTINLFAAAPIRQ